jgi:serine O-acetyltransferase
MRLIKLLDLIGFQNDVLKNFAIDEKLNRDISLDNNVIIKEIYNLQNEILSGNFGNPGGDLIHALMVIQRMICGVELYPTAKIGENFEVIHGGGVVIAGTAVIGDNVKIFSGVVIGDRAGKMAAPKIGNNVTIYANSTVYGDITIGDDVVIGANSSVGVSIPAGMMVLGGPDNVRPKC